MPVSLDGLAEQRHLAHPTRGQVLDLDPDVPDGAAALAATPVGDDAVGAELVAAMDDGHVGGRAVGRDEGGRPELAAQVLEADGLHDRLELLRAGEDVDEGVAALELVGLQADHAAHDGDSELLALAAQLLQRAQLADRPLLGVVADRAGVEDDQVGLLRPGRLRPAEATEAGGQLLGVRLVHLAADGPDVVAHTRSSTNKAGGSSASLYASSVSLLRWRREWDS